MRPHQHRKQGFTLIQMSVALIIIGLIIGGVLTGNHLKNAAAVAAQVSQINKFNTAIVLFQTKTGYLPGDIPNPYATQYGFQSRGAYGGEGDGNNIIEGNCQNVAGFGGEIPGFDIACGELAVFWQDLTTANLIDSSIGTGAGYPQINAAVYVDPTTVPSFSGWLPTAKLGKNNFVYVFSVGGVNYFAVSSVTKLSWYLYGNTSPGLTVQQAYAIDTKIDDGLPQSGNVVACYVNENIAVERGVSAAGNGLEGANGGNSFTSFCVPTTAATPYLYTNCYDNNNIAGKQTYSIAKNANVQNCALSFQFQTQ